MLSNLKEYFNRFGLEGTEQKIKEVYEYSAVIQKKYLDLYKLILKGGISL